MSAVNVLAAIFAVIVLVKMVSLFFINKDKVMKLAESMFKQVKFVKVLFLVLAAVIGYFLIMELGILAVVAVMLFAHMLIGLLFIHYPKLYLSFAKGFLKDMKKAWLLILIWVILAVWALIELLI